MIGLLVSVSAFTLPGNNAISQNNTTLQQNTSNASNSSDLNYTSNSTKSTSKKTSVSTSSNNKMSNPANTPNTSNSNNEPHSISAQQAKQIVQKQLTASYTAGDPILKTESNSPYWNVPVFNPQGKRVGYTQIDAQTGAYLGGNC